VNPDSRLVDAAIDRAAMALVTPRPDDGFVTRVVTRLPERPVGVPRAWWVAAGAAAVLAWLVLAPPEPAPWRGLEPASRPFTGSGGTPPGATPPGALVATGPSPGLSPAPSGVAPDVPRVGWPAREDVPVRMPVHVAEEDPWGLRAIEPPPALIVTGLASTEPPTAVAPLAVVALPPPAALHDMKE
jgi:hypothetical protein